MPRGDRTGPAGMGPMTGRAAGYCAGYDMPGYMNPYGGRLAPGAFSAFPPTWGPGMYPVAQYGWGGYPAFGWPRRTGRGFGFGFGLGRGRGRGRGRRWWW
jgi:hypothetical protein